MKSRNTKYGLTTAGNPHFLFPFDFGGELEYIYILLIRMIAENLENLRKRVERTCLQCGRKPEDIQLVAVSKSFPPESVREAVEAGQLDFGENYVQELQEKNQYLSDHKLRWHFIGRLQSNKVKYIAEYIHMIHSVDNLNLGKEISKRAGRYNRVQSILVEVHTTDEQSKSGIEPEKAVGLIKELSGLPNLKVCGLMTMGPFSDDPGDSRPSFRRVMELKKQIETEGIENIEMSSFSMGMSHDFEVAIEEGSNIIRVGTAIFGRRMKNVN